MRQPRGAHTRCGNPAALTRGAATPRRSHAGRQPRGARARCGNPAALALGAATTRCSHTVRQSRGARTQCSNHAALARGAATTRRPHAVRQPRGARTRSGLQPHGARSRCWRHLLRRRFLLWAAAARCTLGAALAAVDARAVDEVAHAKPRLLPDLLRVRPAVAVYLVNQISIPGSVAFNSCDNTQRWEHGMPRSSG